MRRALVVGLMAAFGMALAIPNASAHALLRSSTPSGGALLQSAPPDVLITFTEPPDITLSSVRVLDSSGKDVTRNKAELVSGRALQLRLRLPSLEKGVYVVAWRVVSRVDGHLTAGTFAFGIGVEPAVATPGNEAGTAYRPSALAVAGRFGLAGGLALLLGAATVGLFVLGRPASGRRGPILAWLLAAGGLGALVSAERSQIGIGLSDLLASQRGELLVREGIAVLIVGIAVVMLSLRPGRTTLVVLAGATAAALLTHALAGHAGGAQSARPAKVGAQWIHLLAVGVWAGGLLWVLLASRGDASPERLAALKRYSRLAGGALAVVVLTGTLRALDEIGAFGRLTSTDFGIAFVVKMGVVAGLVALGALNRYRILPALGRGARRLDAFRRTTGTEVALAAVVLGVTGVLAGLPPSAIEAQARKATPERIVATGSDFATSVRVRLVVTPGTTGLNRFELTAADYDTGRPVDATIVKLLFSLPARPDIPESELELRREATTWRADSASLAVEGRWKVVALVQTASTSVEVPLELRTRERPQDIRTLPGAPGQPTIYEISLGAGRTVQSYVDPAKTNVVNQIHFTFFDPAGQELPTASARMEATKPDGSTAALEVRRFGPGHFVAEITPAAGTWRFRVEARTESGEEYRAFFDQPIG